MTPYLTIDEAEDYFETRLETELWDYSSEEEKFRALCEATRSINRLAFKGTPTVSNQENKFPRSPDLAVIQDIKIATCEIAYALLDGMNMEQEIENLSVTDQSYAAVRTGYNPQLVVGHMKAGIPSAKAWLYLLPYLINPKELTLSRG